jgi:hypothetical protein
MSSPINTLPSSTWEEEALNVNDIALAESHLLKYITNANDGLRV